MDLVYFFFQAEDGIRDYKVTGVQTCALPISSGRSRASSSCRNVMWASALDATCLAWNSVPSSSATPFTRPRRVTIFATGLDRKSVGEGKRGEFGGRRIIKKKKK